MRIEKAKNIIEDYAFNDTDDEDENTGENIVSSSEEEESD